MKKPEHAEVNLKGESTKQETSQGRHLTAKRDDACASVEDTIIASEASRTAADAASIPSSSKDELEMAEEAEVSLSGLPRHLVVGLARRMRRWVR